MTASTLSVSTARRKLRGGALAPNKPLKGKVPAIGYLIYIMAKDNDQLVYTQAKEAVEAIMELGAKEYCRQFKLKYDMRFRP